MNSETDQRKLLQWIDQEILTFRDKTCFVDRSIGTAQEEMLLFMHGRTGAGKVFVESICTVVSKCSGQSARAARMSAIRLPPNCTPAGCRRGAQVSRLPGEPCPHNHHTPRFWALDGSP